MMSRFATIALLFACSAISPIQAIGQIAEQTSTMSRVVDRNVLSRNDIPVTIPSMVAYLNSLQDSEAAAKRAAEIVSSLGSPRYAERHAAQTEILEIGVPAIPALEAARDSSDIEVRERVVRLLGQLGVCEVESVVVACLRQLEYLEADGIVELALNSMQATVSDFANREITRLIERNAKPKHLKLVVAGLEHWSENVRCASIHAFGKLDSSPSATDRMRGLLTSDSDSVSLAAATVLLRRGEKAGGVRLVQLLDFKDGRIRSAAFDVLQEFSGSSFNYVPYGLAAMRQPALAKWTGWLRAQPDILEKRTVSVARKEEVQQVLLSTSSGSVQLCDLTGAVRFSIPMSAYDAQLLLDGRIVIAGRDSGSALVVDQDGKKLRVIENLKSPSDIEYLPNDNLLVLENGTGIAKEFNARGHPVWQVQGLENPFDIDRLPNGNTLIADSGNNRLVEFDPRGEIVWECKDIGFVNNVVRLRNGNTAYTTYTSGEVIVVSPEKMKLHEAHLKGSTLYAIQEIGDQLVVADGAGMQIIWLDQRCKTQKTTQLPFKFMDAFFTR